MARKIILKNSGQVLIDLLKGCDGFYLPPNQILVDFETVTIDKLKAKVKNNLDYLSPRHDTSLLNAYGVMTINRQHFEILLSENPNSTSFRIYFGAKTSDHVQDDISLIIVPIGEDRKDIINDETCVIECEKPPGCQFQEGALLIDESDLRQMFPDAPVPS